MRDSLVTTRQRLGVFEVTRSSATPRRRRARQLGCVSIVFRAVLGLRTRLSWSAEVVSSVRQVSSDLTMLVLCVIRWHVCWAGTRGSCEPVPRGLHGSEPRSATSDRPVFRMTMGSCVYPTRPDPVVRWESPASLSTPATRAPSAQPPAFSRAALRRRVARSFATLKGWMTAPGHRSVCRTTKTVRLRRATRVSATAESRSDLRLDAGLQSHPTWA